MIRSGHRDERLNLVGLVYDAALDPALWPAFLRALAMALGAHAPTLFSHECPTGQGAVSIALDVDDDHIRKYRDYYAERNVLLRRGGALLAEGRVRTSHMMCPDRELIASEYYNDYMRPLDLFSGVGATILKDGSRTFNLSVFRPHRFAVCGESEVALVQAILPHLNRALRVHRRIADLQLRERSLEEAFDRLPTAVLLVDRTGRILFANARGVALLAEGDAVGSDRGRLRAGTTGGTAMLRRSIHNAVHLADLLDADESPVIRLDRRTSDAPIWAVAIPVRPGEDASGWAVPAVALFLHDAGARRPTGHALLAAAYGLTQAEARLADLLAAGCTLAEAAQTLGTTTHTVRTQVKAIFGKTGVRRQGDLQRLLHLGPFGHRSFARHSFG